MADGCDKSITAVDTCEQRFIGQRDDSRTSTMQSEASAQLNNTSKTDITEAQYSDNENSVLHRDVDVGGVTCDEEYHGCPKFDRNTNTTSSAYLPRLVFLDSDENISGSFTEQFSIYDDRFIREERSASNGGELTDIPVKLETDLPVGQSKLIAESFKDTNNADRLLQTRISRVSLHSSDSDLICDHTMPVDRELENVGEEDFEQYLQEHMEDDPRLNDWHCHSTAVKIPPDQMARNQLIAVSVLCFLFMCGEAVGGVISNSLALFTDVLHLGSDLISFLISLLSMYLAKKPSTRNMSFGYHRTEVLGALISVFIIWSVTGVLVYMAVERIVHVHYKDVKADEMLITAVLGVIFNIVMGIILHSEVCCGKSSSLPSFGHGHSHSSHSQGGHSQGGGHGHSHKSLSNLHHQNGNNFQRIGSDRHSSQEGTRWDGYEQLLPDEENLQMTAEEAHRNPHINNVSDVSDKPHPKNINVRAAFIHVIGDIIQSMGVLLAAIIIKLKPEEKYRLADPICTFLFSILVLFTTINVLNDTLRIMLEGVPRDANYYTIKTSLQKIPGVKAVHGLTIWCLTLEKNALAVHLAIDRTVSHQRVLVDASAVLENKYNLVETTIQVEYYQPAIMAQCSSCQELKK